MIDDDRFQRIRAGVLLASPSAMVGASVLLVAAIGLVDFLTGYRLRISIFYLLPVLGSTWRAGKVAGLGVSILAALVWLWADIAARASSAFGPLAYWNALVTLGFFTICVLILSAFRNERSVSRTCPLTGLANRLAFYESAEEEILRSHRYPGPLSVIFLDLDDFKDINDRFGHRAGDAALKTVARILASHVRALDLPARLGGDEFAVLLPQAGPAAAEFVARELRDLLGGSDEGRRGPIRCSVGVVTFERPPNTVDDLVRAADEEMYAAKRTGKNLVRTRVIRG